MTSPSTNKSLGRFIAAEHKAASRMLGYTLTLDDYEAWNGFTCFLRARLRPRDCASLAFSALKALDAEDAEKVSETVLGRAGAGMPGTALSEVMDEAAFWADMASPTEREAYALASFQAIPETRQADFLDFVQGRRAA